jgi:hypothetical protein
MSVNVIPYPSSGRKRSEIIVVLDVSSMALIPSHDDVVHQFVWPLCTPQHMTSIIGSITTLVRK